MRRGMMSMILGLLLIVAALSLTGYNLWEDKKAGDVAQDALAQLTPMITNVAKTTVSDVEEYPDYILNPDMDMPETSLNGKNYIGVLKILSLDIELPVLGQWSYSNLKIAPCLYSGTAYNGNMVICAHNYQSHFGQLKNISIGDLITFTDIDGNVFAYRVLEVETLQSAAVEEMISDDYDFTLFTCTLSGRSRVTVRCEKCN